MNRTLHLAVFWVLKSDPKRLKVSLSLLLSTLSFDTDGSPETRCPSACKVKTTTYLRQTIRSLRKKLFILQHKISHRELFRAERNSWFERSNYLSPMTKRPEIQEGCFHLFWQFRLPAFQLCFETETMTFLLRLSSAVVNVRLKDKYQNLHSANRLSTIKTTQLTAPFNNMRTLKFEAQPTNGFFAAVNQVFGGSS